MFKVFLYNNTMTEIGKKKKKKKTWESIYLAFIEQQLSFERYIIIFLGIIIDSYCMHVPLTHYNSW